MSDHAPSPDLAMSLDALARNARETGFVRGLRLAIHLARRAGQRDLSDAFLNVLVRDDTCNLANDEFEKTLADLGVAS